MPIRASREDADFNDLKERLQPICKRTLRKQVLEYINYTNRHALVQEFVPTDEEQRLYDLVSEYLQNPAPYALPASQRPPDDTDPSEATGILDLRDFRHAGWPALKLETAAAKAEAVDSPADNVAEILEEFDELADEWERDEREEIGGQARSAELLVAIRPAGNGEAPRVSQLAKSITKNSKGEVF